MRVMTLAEFPPSNYPIAAAKLDWVVGPVGVTSESDALECANFKAVERRFKELDPDELTWEAVQFAHFGAGWVQMFFTAPGTDCHRVALEFKDFLRTTMVLDDELLAEMTEEAAPDPTPTPQNPDHPPLTVSVAELDLIDPSKMSDEEFEAWWRANEDADAERYCG